jgi:hypothetical protein
MPWTEPQKGRELPESHYLRALNRIKQVEIEKKYPRLNSVLGGEIFIKTKLEEISDALQNKDHENIPALTCDVSQAISALRNFAEASNLHTGTPDKKMLSDFAGNLEVDEHGMLRIMSHCLFILSVNLHEMSGKQIYCQ